MKFIRRRSLSAFALVFLMAASSQGHAPAVAVTSEAIPCQLASVSSARSIANGQDEIVLAPTALSSYGWVAGKLKKTGSALCLTADAKRGYGVSFNACNSADRRQAWQWKAQADSPGGDVVSVLQHPLTGMVLERVPLAKNREIFELADYRVGAETQRFSLRACLGTLS